MGMTGSFWPLYMVERPLGDAGSGTTCSAKVSVTSIGLTVAPQEMKRLLPTITPGVPAKPLPMASVCPAWRWTG